MDPTYPADGQPGAIPTGFWIQQPDPTPTHQCQLPDGPWTEGGLWQCTNGHLWQITSPPPPYKGVPRHLQWRPAGFWTRRKYGPGMKRATLDMAPDKTRYPGKGRPPKSPSPISQGGLVKPPLPIGRRWTTSGGAHTRFYAEDMATTEDPSNPALTHGPDEPGTAPGQAPVYLVLSEAERPAGYIRPIRTTYLHTVCGTATTMGLAIAKTYARDPGFYGSTYCATCQEHRPVGADGEFVWEVGGSKVGT
jgi:hypothetical protein